MVRILHTLEDAKYFVTNVLQAKSPDKKLDPNIIIAISKVILSVADDNEEVIKIMRRETEK